MERQRTVVDTTYKILYSDEAKSRVVTEKNVKSFKPKQFYSQDFFQKRTSFSYEQEVRTIWTFIYMDENGMRQPLQLPHPDLDFVDLELGSLPISKESVDNNFPIKTSTPKSGF